MKDIYHYLKFIKVLGAFVILMLFHPVAYTQVKVISTEGLITDDGQIINTCITGVMPDELNFPFDGGSQIVFVETANSSCLYTANSGCSWVTLSKSGTRLTINCGPNAEKIGRFCTITLSDGYTTSLSQDGRPSLAQPGLISGPNSVCKGTSTTFSISPVSGATNYFWAATNGVVSGGQGTTNATITFSGSGSSNISVTASNIRDTSSSQNKAVIVNNNPEPPTVADVSKCGDFGSFLLTATPGNNGNSVRWYYGSGNGILVATGSSYSTEILKGSATFYVASYNTTTGCESSRVTQQAILNTPPKITSQPVESVVCEGNTATFSVIASGNGLLYQWQMMASNGSEWGNIAGATSTTYTATAQLSASNNKYRCIVSGNCGSVTSNAATLTLATKPSITTQPTGVTVCEGMPATFSIVATGNALKYQWERMLNGDSNWVPITGYNSSSFTLPSVTTGTCQYRCIVSNGCGSSVTSNSATLWVNSKPAIAVQPQSISAAPNVTVMFGLKANGTALNYQWQQSTDQSTWSNIAGATGSSFNAASVSSYYRCIVGGSCAPTVTSSIARVTTATNPLPGVFISEYIEGSGYNKAVEITNLSGYVVDLSQIRLEKDQDGDGIFSSSLTLSGQIAPGASFVVANNKASAVLLAKANFTTNSMALEFNGNDQLRLVCQGVVIDALGTPNGVNFGKDVTLVRSRALNTDEQYTPWITFPCDYLQHLGQHTKITAVAGVFISEYVEGSNFDKAIEIYNGTGNYLDLEKFALQKDLDGTGVFGEVILLNGTLKPNGVLVVANQSAATAILSVAKVTTNTAVLNFNGDDQVRLLYFGKEIDRIGIPGNVAFGENKTLVRKPEVLTGTPMASGIDSWISFVTGDISHLGWHQANVQTTLTLKPDYTKNFIATYTPNQPLTDVSKMEKGSLEVAYFDGLGRLSQSIGVGASPNGGDVVSTVQYDQFGRKSRNYLPMVAFLNNGAFVSGAVEKINAFYATGAGMDGVPTTGVPYSETLYENSMLNRALEINRPGEDFAIVRDASGQSTFTGHTTKTREGINLIGEVLRFAVSGTTLGYYTEAGSVGSTVAYYPEGYLSVSTVIDANGATHKEYTTYEGLKVLDKAIANGESLETYYVYNDLGQLRYVLSPKAVKAIAASGISQTVLNELAYYYAYDGRGRTIEKRIPGAEPVYIVYNNQDQLVLMQDGNMRVGSAPYWLYTKYDYQGRTICQGKFFTSLDRSLLQKQVDALTFNQQYEDIQANGTYSNKAFPTSSTEPLSYNFYDNYNVAGIAVTTPVVMPGIILPETLAEGKGLVTVHKYKVLGEEKWLYDVTFYDAKYRAVQTYKTNYLGGTDISTNTLDFGGNPLRLLHQHTVPGKTVVYEDVTNTYDRAGRLLNQQVEYRGGVVKASTKLASYSYNELGQLATKDLKNGIQQINYKYNLQGWLTAINDPENLGNDKFGLKLLYSESEALSFGATKRQFTGNVAAEVWSNTTGIIGGQAYGFNYDGFSRLTNACYRTKTSTTWTTPASGYDLTSVSYDANGNIQSLERHNSGNVMDKLTYGYYNGGNRLQKVDDAGNKGEGFQDGATVANEYTYDNNGSMVTDANQNLTAKYNLLNLPESYIVNGITFSYTYAANGEKVAESGQGQTTVYDGNFIYENGVLSKILNREGYLYVATNTTPIYRFHLTDHLGNVRCIVDESGAVNLATNYYPFGGRFGNNYGISPQGSNLFNGKELQKWGETYDFGARMYDPMLGRWHVADPLAEEATDWTPYRFGFDNPINFNDPTGMFEDNSSQLDYWLSDEINNDDYGDFIINEEATQLIDEVVVVGEDKKKQEELEEFIRKFHEKHPQDPGRCEQDYIIEKIVFTALGIGPLITTIKIIQFVVSKPATKELTNSQIKSISSYKDLIARHQQKLAEYIKDPMKFDNKGLLKNAPSEAVRQRIIDSRVKHLETEIKTFQDNIQKILNGF